MAAATQRAVGAGFVSKSPQSLKASLIAAFEQKSLSNIAVDISRIADYCTVEHLVEVFPTLLEYIFDFYAQQGNKWKLLQFTKTNLPTNDYVAVSDVLSPQGPMFKIIYRLMALPNPNIFTFCSAESQMIEGHALQMHTWIETMLFNRPVILNAFDFYMCHFAFCVVNPRRSRFDEWHRETAMLYFTTCVNYWHHFLPLDNTVILSIEEELRAFNVLPHKDIHQPPTSPASTVTSQHSELIFRLSPETRKRISSHSPDVPGSPLLDMKLFRTPSLNEVLAQPNVISNIDFVNDNAVWRSESMSHMFCEIWLGTYYHKNLQHSADDSLTGSDVQRIIRAFIKHLHCFSFHDCAGSTNITSGQQAASLGMSYYEHYIVSIQHLKKSMHLNIIQGHMYKFLCRNLHNSPLDTSYRLILETWLSYIQPWRYIDVAGYSVNEDRTVGGVWEPFVCSNFLFYTQIFHIVINKLMEFTVTTELKALFLFRVSKIFALPNLSTMLQRVEKGYMSGDMSSLENSGNVQLINSHMSRCLGDTEYVPLYGSGSSIKLKQCMSHIEDLYFSLRRRKEVDEPHDTYQGLHIFQPFHKLHDWLMAEPTSSEFSDAQVLAHLKDAHHKICDAFQIDERDLDDSFELLKEQLRPPKASYDISKGVENGLRVAGSDHILTSTPLVESVVQKQAVTSDQDTVKRSRVPDIQIIPQTRTDPELMAARPWELQLLVTLFYSLTLALHKKYGVFFNKIYYRTDVIGFLVQPFLTAPPVLHYRARGTKVQHNYPPRLSFRFLASYYTICFVALTVLYCHRSGCNIIITIVTALAMAIWCRLYEYFVHCAQIF